MLFYFLGQLFAKINWFKRRKEKYILTKLLAHHGPVRIPLIVVICIDINKIMLYLTLFASLLMKTQAKKWFRNKEPHYKD